MIAAAELIRVLNRASCLNCMLIVSLPTTFISISKRSRRVQEGLAWLWETHAVGQGREVRIEIGVIANA